MKGLGKIDWRVVQRYTSPQAIKDLDGFLDSLPTNVGYNALAAAGIAWIIAAGAVVFTSVEVGKMSSIRAEMMKVEALQPPIPQLQYMPINKDTLEDLCKKIESTYGGVTATSSGDGQVKLSANDTDYFPQFMGAINTLQNGGRTWRATVDSLCAGMECKSSKLSADLKVESATIGAPAPEEAPADAGSAPAGMAGMPHMPPK